MYRPPCAHPSAAYTVRRIAYRVRRKGKGCQRSEADRLADHIAVIDGGRVVAEGSPAELKRRLADQRVELTFTDAVAFDEAIRHLGVLARHADPDRHTLSVATDGSAAHVRALLDELDPSRSTVRRFTVHTATLDDVFLELTARV